MLESRTNEAINQYFNHRDELDKEKENQTLKYNQEIQEIARETGRGVEEIEELIQDVQHWQTMPIWVRFPKAYLASILICGALFTWFLCVSESGNTDKKENIQLERLK